MFIAWLKIMLMMLFLYMKAIHMKTNEDGNFFLIKRLVKGYCELLKKISVDQVASSNVITTMQVCIWFLMMHK
jgi:hypothetical protein